MQEMEIIGVRLEMPANVPVVLLRERDDLGRILPIFVGSPEATAISLALEGTVPPRPMTHDLFRDVLAQMGIEVERLVITELNDRTFYAELHLRHGDVESVVSSRPSDGIALAIRVGAPVFAVAEVLDEAGYVPEAEVEHQEVVEEFKAFIEEINPEDFGSTS